MELVIRIPEEVYKAYKTDSTLSILSADQKAIAKSYLINGLINGLIIGTSEKGYKQGVSDVLDKIRIEIKNYRSTIDKAISEDELKSAWIKEACVNFLEIIDKCKAENKKGEKG